MITNTEISYYSKALNAIDKIEIWRKTHFPKVWKFNRNGSIPNTGITESNQVDIRIPLEDVEDVTIFHIGDLVAVNFNADIETQQDLNGIEHYVITSVTINNFGNNPHVHLVGG